GGGWRARRRDAGPPATIDRGRATSCPSSGAAATAGGPTRPPTPARQPPRTPPGPAGTAGAPRRSPSRHGRARRSSVTPTAPAPLGSLCLRVVVLAPQMG